MRKTFIIIVAALACGCVKRATEQQHSAETPQPVTFVGCVEQGATPDEIVIKGRSVDQHVVATTGTAPGGLANSESLRGGDADRTPTRGGTREDWGERISPKLVATGGQDFRKEMGHRVVVTGEFVPATMEQPLDQLKVRSLARVSDHCSVQ